MFNTKIRKYDDFPETKGTIPIIVDDNLIMLAESYELCKKYFDEEELAKAVLFNLTTGLNEIVK